MLETVISVGVKRFRHAEVLSSHVQPAESNVTFSQSDMRATISSA